MEIYYDSFHEGMWFKELHTQLNDAKLSPFPSLSDVDNSVTRLLSYDRPDIILCDGNNNPILVIERTVEVPSGHNVGQRFARIVAAARFGIPSVYFGPYAAYKHGGETQGPRYMNLRLFYAVENLIRIENSPVTMIRWPVDADYEIIQTPEKNNRIINYLDMFFHYFNSSENLDEVCSNIINSEFTKFQHAERTAFIKNEIRRPEQYSMPPNSVQISPWKNILPLASFKPENINLKETVFYIIGAKNIRSDPYTGMALLYSYLYCGGLSNPTRNLVLHFPQIKFQKWVELDNPSRRPRKDIRLYKLAADGILFQDGYLPIK